MVVTDARTIWNALKGIICVYKPADVKVSQVRKTIIGKICSGNKYSCNVIIAYLGCA